MQKAVNTKDMKQHPIQYPGKKATVFRGKILMYFHHFWHPLSRRYVLL